MVKTRSMIRKACSQVKEDHPKHEHIKIAMPKLPKKIVMKKIKTRKSTVPKITDKITKTTAVKALDDTLSINIVKKFVHKKYAHKNMRTTLLFLRKDLKDLDETVPNVSNTDKINEETAVNALDVTLFWMENLNHLDETKEHIKRIDETVKSEISLAPLKPRVKRLRFTSAKSSPPTSQDSLDKSALKLSSLDESTDSSDEDSFSYEQISYEQMRTRFTK